MSIILDALRRGRGRQTPEPNPNAAQTDAVLQTLGYGRFNPTTPFNRIKRVLAIARARHRLGDCAVGRGHLDHSGVLVARVAARGCERASNARRQHPASAGTALPRRPGAPIAPAVRTLCRRARRREPPVAPDAPAPAQPRAPTRARATVAPPAAASRSSRTPSRPSHPSHLCTRSRGRAEFHARQCAAAAPTAPTGAPSRTRCQRRPARAAHGHDRRRSFQPRHDVSAARRVRERARQLPAGAAARRSQRRSAQQSRRPLSRQGTVRRCHPAFSAGDRHQPRLRARAQQSRRRVSESAEARYGRHPVSRGARASIRRTSSRW